ncbi:hypothetical protein E2C01_030464 [Portunus trituberculatus]|uniref:Uncharacterized protein n=1 Tax=Portunus trituberculatus TaxID=210409 RepID=A0A5B7EQX0_PORTR|nr:hypothetical protein [Portunus trituberculatus]
MVVVFVVIKIFGGRRGARGIGVCSGLPISVSRVLGVSNKLPRYHHHCPAPTAPQPRISAPSPAPLLIWPTLRRPATAAAAPVLRRCCWRGCCCCLHL